MRSFEEICDCSFIHIINVCCSIGSTEALLWSLDNDGQANACYITTGTGFITPCTMTKFLLRLAMLILFSEFLPKAFHIYCHFHKSLLKWNQKPKKPFGLYQLIRRGYFISSLSLAFGRLTPPGDAPSFGYRFPVLIMILIIRKILNSRRF